MKLKYGLIGCGRIGPKHAWAFKKNNVDLVWTCDLELEKAKSIANEYCFKKVTTNYMDIINDDSIDIVSIATDHKSHSEIAINALKNGKHVLVEKPMAINSKEAKKMITTSKKYNKILSPVSQHQYDPLVLEIKKLFDEKVFGKLITTNAILQGDKSKEYYTKSYWRGKKSLEGGSTLINQAIHTLNVTNWLVGRPKRVKSLQKNFKFKNIIDTEDSICCLIEYSNGAIGSLLSTNASVTEIDPKIEIIGLKGAISFDLAFPNRLIYLFLDDKKLETMLTKRLKKAEKKRLHPPKNLSYYGIGHFFQVKDFLDCVKSNKTPMLTKEAGLEAIEIVEKIYKNRF